MNAHRIQGTVVPFKRPGGLPENEEAAVRMGVQHDGNTSFDNSESSTQHRVAATIAVLEAGAVIAIFSSPAEARAWLQGGANEY